MLMKISVYFPGNVKTKNPDFHICNLISIRNLVFCFIGFNCPKCCEVLNKVECSYIRFHPAEKMYRHNLVMNRVNPVFSKCTLQKFRYNDTAMFLKKIMTGDIKGLHNAPGIIFSSSIA